jgi:hypothetical protein
MENSAAFGRCLIGSTTMGLPSGQSRPRKLTTEMAGEKRNEAWAWSLPSMLWSRRAASTMHFSSLAMETCKLSFKLCNGWA